MIDVAQAHRIATEVWKQGDVGAAAETLAQLERAIPACEANALDAFDLANLGLARMRLRGLSGGDPLGRVALIDETVRHARSLTSAVEDQRLLIQVLCESACALREVGSFAEVRSLLVEAAELSSHELGENDPNTAVAHNELGLWARYFGDAQLARECYEHALAIAVHNCDPGQRADVLHNLASLEHLCGNPSQARVLIDTALSLRDRGDRAVQADLGVRAAVLADLGDIDAARGAYRDLSDAIIASEGRTCSEIAFLHANWGVLEHSAGDGHRAKGLYLHALTASEAALGVDHAQSGVICANLARLYLDLGDTAAAACAARRAVRIFEGRVSVDLPSHRLARGVLDALTA